jgi:hypothetical protein
MIVSSPFYENLLELQNSNYQSIVLSVNKVIETYLIFDENDVWD